MFGAELGVCPGAVATEATEPVFLTASLVPLKDGKLGAVGLTFAGLTLGAFVMGFPALFVFAPVVLLVNTVIFAIE
jgi:hypothetical protein